MSINDIMQAFMNTAYSDLFRNYTLWTAACVLLFLVLPVSIIRMLQKKGKKHAFLYKYTTPKKGHYVFLLLFLFSGIRNIFTKSSQFTTVGFVTAIIIAIFVLASVVQLIRWKPSGIVLTYIALFLFAAQRNYAWLSLYSDETASSLIERYTYFPFNEFLFFASVMTSVVAILTAVFVAVYYYRRRFLFRDVKGVRCSTCGNYIFPKDDYCICCGQKLTLNPITSPLPARLDKEQYCHKCGRRIHWNDKCLFCDKDVVKETIKEKGKKITIGIACAAVAVAILFVPLIQNINLERGTSKIHNAFVEEWNEFYENGKGDATWLQRFNSVLDALYTVDSRWLYVDPREVRLEAIQYYIDYSLASFDQMQVLSEMRDLVNGGDGDKDDLQERFNQTVDKMVYASANRGIVRG